jgi:hypothetical protein
MADSDKVILLKIEVAQAQANANIKKLEKSIESLDGRTKEYRLTLKKLQLERAKYAELRARDTKATIKHADVLKNANLQTGAATSATLEFGRVLSDMPYGIRGVANNLQQLASNLFFMSKQVDGVTGKSIGFGGAIGSLIKNLAGPAGLLVAFQGVTALIDFFANKQDNAKKETEETTSVLQQQRDELAKLTDEYEDYIKIRQQVIQTTTKEREMMKALAAESLDKLNSDERRNRALSKLIELYPKYFDGLKIDNLKGIFDAEENVNRVLQNKLKLKQALERAEEIANAIQIEKLKISKDTKNADLTKIFQLREEQKEVRGLVQMYSSLDLELKKNDKTKITPIKDPKDFDEDAEDYLDQIRSLEKKTELLNAKSQAAKIIIQRRYHLEDLKRKNTENLDEFNLEAEAYRAKLKLFLDYQVSIGKMTKSQANQQLSDFDKTIKKEIDEMNTNFPILLGKWESYYTKKIELAKEAEMMGAKVPKTKDKEEFTLEDGLKKYMELQSSMTSFLNGEYDRQLTIEQNKTNALNNELNQRLLNENLSKDERERIQLQIGQNDEKLRKKQEEIEKKRFKLNKAANIAGALIDTYLASQKAFASQIIVGDPTSLPRALLAKKIAIVSGLLNVAAIARQKFQSSAGSGGAIGAAAGSNGGGDNTREFNFNLAGSTQSNQLTQSIAGQLSQPIQTYVVSSEITSQQQLDLNIANTATIGG